jgi:hypothetical protein
MEKFWLLVHITGVIFGAGSVTTAYARELYFKKHPQDIEGKGFLPVIKTLLNIGFVLVIVSGIGLYFQTPTELNANPLFWVKMGLVILLLLNHILINLHIRANKHKLRGLHIFSEYYSLVGWYLIIILGVTLH